MGIGSPAYLEGLPFHKLAKLLYRDNVDVKHSDRTRLCRELHRNKALEFQAEQEHLKELKIHRNKFTPMAEVILHHLVEACVSFKFQEFGLGERVTGILPNNCSCSCSYPKIPKIHLYIYVHDHVATMVTGVAA